MLTKLEGEGIYRHLIILVVEILINLSYEYNFPLVLVFIDYRKSFDTVYKKEVKHVLDSAGIESGYKDHIKYIYDKAKPDLSINKEKRSVQINRGTRQEDVLSE